MTAIYRGPNAGYAMTHEDALWFGRALTGEVGPDATREQAQWHFWTWMDRFHLWSSSKWQGPTGIPRDGAFGPLLIQYHSKAVSPYWLVEGRGGCAQYPEDCKPEKLAYRNRLARLTQAEMERSGVWKHAQEALNGTLERPTGEALYDFAACSLTGAQGRPCSGYDVDRQCFLPYRCLRSKDVSNLVKNADGTLPDAVTLGTPVVNVVRTTVGVLFAAALAWAAWTLYDKRKRR